MDNPADSGLCLQSVSGPGPQGVVEVVVVRTVGGGEVVAPWPGRD